MDMLFDSVARLYSENNISIKQTAKHLGVSEQKRPAHTKMQR